MVDDLGCYISLFRSFSFSPSSFRGEITIIIFSPSLFEGEMTTQRNITKWHKSVTKEIGVGSIEWVSIAKQIVSINLI